MREVVHEAKNVIKDQVEEKISHIANVDTPVHLVRPILQSVEEIENDQEGQEVKTEIRRINVLKVAVQIEEKEQVTKMILSLQRPGTVRTIQFCFKYFLNRQTNRLFVLTVTTS